MTIGVSSYSFNQAIEDGRITQYGAIDKAAVMGFTSMDFSVMSTPGDSPMEAAEKIRKRCQDAGVKVQNYAVGADFLKNGISATVETLKEEVRVAAQMGALTMRHDATQGFVADNPRLVPFSHALPLLAEGYRAVTEYAATFGIRTMIENHGYYCQDSCRVVALIDTVGHENFGLLLDIGNFYCADESPLCALPNAAPYAFHVHAKDFHVKAADAPNPGRGWFPTRSGTHLRGAIIGHGDVPVKQAIAMLVQAGYDGTVAIEFEGIEDCFMAIEEGKKNLDTYLR